MAANVGTASDRRSSAKVLEITTKASCLKKKTTTKIKTKKF